MQNPIEFDLSNYYYRKVYHSYECNHNGCYRHNTHGDTYHFDINGNRIDYVNANSVASKKSTDPISNIDIENTNMVFNHSVSATDHIYMSYDNYVSLLSEINNHKQQLVELKNEIDKLKQFVTNPNN